MCIPWLVDIRSISAIKLQLLVQHGVNCDANWKAAHGLNQLNTFYLHETQSLNGVGQNWRSATKVKFQLFKIQDHNKV